MDLKLSEWQSGAPCVCSLGGARKHSLGQGQASAPAPCCQCVEQGALGRPEEERVLVVAENLCRQVVNTGLENCSPRNPRELAICKYLWLLTHILCPVPLWHLS